MKLNLTVNGKKRELDVSPQTRLLDILRDELHLTGTKEGCGKGECGACTVILNGELAASCLVLALQVDGGEVTTIEGPVRGERLDPLQEAFIESGAVQCGFCTPGMILAARKLLDEIPEPTEEEIRRGLSGNLCRCTGYQKIVEAVKRAAAGDTALLPEKLDKRFGTTRDKIKETGSRDSIKDSIEDCLEKKTGLAEGEKASRSGGDETDG